jgi:hypothetical protein
MYWDHIRENKMSSEPRTRFQDALFIQEGACNISGIAHALVYAANEARKDGVQPSEDVAVRLIVHQLNHLCKVDEINNGLVKYVELVEECKNKNETTKVSA